MSKFTQLYTLIMCSFPYQFYAAIKLGARVQIEDYRDVVTGKRQVKGAKLGVPNPS